MSGRYSGPHLSIACACTSSLPSHRRAACTVQNETSSGGMLAVPLPGVVVDSHKVTPWLAVGILEDTPELKTTPFSDTDGHSQTLTDNNKATTYNKQIDHIHHRNGHLPVHRAASRHPVIEDTRLQVRHDGLIAPCAIAKAHRCPARQTASLDACAHSQSWCGRVTFPSPQMTSIHRTI